MRNCNSDFSSKYPCKETSSFFSTQGLIKACRLWEHANLYFSSSPSFIPWRISSLHPELKNRKKKLSTLIQSQKLQGSWNVWPSYSKANPCSRIHTVVSYDGSCIKLPILCKLFLIMKMFCWRKVHPFQIQRSRDWLPAENYLLKHFEILDCRSSDLFLSALTCC